MVEHLLDWFRSQKGKAGVSPLVWRLEPIIRQSVHLLKPRLETKNIRFGMDVQDELQVFADKEMVELIVRNLLSNAIKFTGSGGHIRIEAVLHEDRVSISVRDSGAGVDPVIGQTLFQEMQPFTPPGTDGERGAGLGLYLCGKFVEMNGGEIGYENNRERGSTFTFTLPAHESTIAQISRRQEREAL